MAALASQQPEIERVPVPKTNRDPTRSLRPAPVYVQIGDRELEIPAMPAADWLEFLMGEWTTDGFLIEFLPHGAELLMDAIEPWDARDLAFSIIEDVSGRHWWVAVRLIQVVTGSWDVMGPEATFNGVDAAKLSLAAWLDAMLVLTIRRMDTDKVPMFTALLEAPPADEELPAEEMEMTAEQFLALGA